jgi:hypothetical protein
MIALHTRSRCDECDRPAAVEVEPDCFLCEQCFGIVLSVLANSNPARAASIASSGETAVIDPQPQSVTANSSSNPGPSLATGMSRDTANAGGEHEAVTALSLNETFEKLDAVTGTSPGACGTERERVGAANFDAEVSALEAEWSRQGVNLSDDPLAIPSFLERKNPDCKFQNSNSLRVRADNEITASSVA